jgi:hypothetical protein
MEVITMDTIAYDLLIARIDKIEQFVVEKKRMNPLTEIWLNIDETCDLLKVSKRTLQTYRDKRIISYSQFCGKIYFKASDIERHLRDNYRAALKKRNFSY